MLEIRQIDKAFGANVVLRGFDLTVGDEEIVCILGPSGCGKTTLLSLCAGLVPPDAGTIVHPDGRPGMVFQEPRLLPWRSVAQNLGLGLLALGVPEKERSTRVSYMAARLGLAGDLALYPAQLSGGMKQRVALGRALAIDPAYLLLDEPFKSLDVALRLSLVKLLLEEWARRPRPIVFVTHDTAEAALTGQRILVLGGRPATIRQEIRLPGSPLRRRPDDPEVLATQGALYALLAEGDTK